MTLEWILIHGISNDQCTGDLRYAAMANLVIEGQSDLFMAGVSSLQHFIHEVY